MAYMTKRVTLSNQTHQCPLSFEVVKEAASQTPAFYDQQGGSKVDRGTDRMPQEVGQWVFGR